MRERGAVAKTHDAVDDRGRVDDDLDRSYATPKRKCASISSSPLFASVAESTVIFGPSARSDARAPAPASRRRAPPACGRGTAPRTRSGRANRAPRRARPSRHWKSAECSLSTGRRSPPPRSRAASASSPAATRLSLFASASVTPRSSAHSVAGRPANPMTAFSTTSGSARSRSSVRSPPTCVSGARPVDRLRARCERATSSSSGFASMISSACRPIEPVRRAGRCASRRASASPAVQAATRPNATIVKYAAGAGEEQRVDPVEHASVPAEQAPGVLHLHVALDRRLEQVADRAPRSRARAPSTSDCQIERNSSRSW